MTAKFIYFDKFQQKDCCQRRLRLQRHFVRLISIWTFTVLVVFMSFFRMTHMKHKVVLLPSYARHTFDLEEVEPGTFRRRWMSLRLLSIDVSELKNYATCSNVSFLNVLLQCIGHMLACKVLTPDTADIPLQLLKCLLLKCFAPKKRKEKKKIHIGSLVM